MSDIRNIINVDNRFGCTYTVDAFNQESADKTFPIIPDAVVVSPEEDKPTGGMWTPWCDSQKDLDAGHYIKITFIPRGVGEKIINYIFQSGAYVYCTDGGKKFGSKKVVGGDASKGKGDYKLEVKTSGNLPLLVLNKY